MSTFKKVLILMFAAGWLLTGCGQRATEVQVTLTEFAIQSSVTDFQVGVPYHFVVTNAGQVDHEFMVMPPLSEDQMGMSMEEMDQMAAVMIEEDELTPGKTQTVDYTFTEPAPAGSLEMACHTSDHYENGMKLPITVK